LEKKTKMIVFTVFCSVSSKYCTSNFVLIIVFKSSSFYC